MGKGKRKSKNMIIGIVIVAVLSVVILSATGLMQMDWSGETEQGSIFTATITGYKDGQPITEPIVMGAFTKGGTAIDSFVVKVFWTSTGTSVDWNTFDLDGTIRVSFLNAYDNWIAEYDNIFTSGDENGQWTTTLVLGTDVCKTANILYGGWFLQFEIDITANVDDTLGQTLSDDLRFVGTVNILYESGFNLDGYAEW